MSAIPSIDASTWLLIAFCGFLLFFGLRIGKTLSGKLNGRIQEIREIVDAARSQKEQTHERMNKRKRDFNEIIAKCHEIQEAADKHISILEKTSVERIQKLEQDMEELLQHRLVALEETYAQDTRTKLSSICHAIIKQMLLQSDIPLNVDHAINDVVRYKDQISA